MNSLFSIFCLSKDLPGSSPINRYRNCVKETVGILGMLCLLFTVVNDGFAKEILVIPGTKISTIQEALNIAENGDVIRLTRSTYLAEDLVIDKSISLVGVDYPVVDGQMKSNLFIIKAANVSIRGLILQNSGVSSIKDKAGIRVENASQIQIIDNRLINTCFGIYLAKVKGGIIQGNTVQGMHSVVQSGNGIHLWYSSNILIFNNKVQGQRDGIYFEFATQCKISHNTCEKNHRYGLHFMFSNNDEYTFNTFRNNGCGVAVMYTKNILMKFNRFERNWGSSSYGLLLKDISKSTISNNIFSTNSSGIYMEGTNEVKAERNHFLNNGLAVRLLANCEKDTFQFNNFIGNTFDFTTNGSENLNYLHGNYWDKYSGYDLNRDTKGDLPYRPVSLYSQIIERLPSAVFLLRSFLAELMDKVERALPSLTYKNLSDQEPSMHIIR